LLLSALIGLTITSFAQLTPPETKKQAKVFKEHGRERVDNYFWLSDKSDSNVINHLKAENAYTEAYLKKTEGLQKSCTTNWWLVFRSEINRCLQNATAIGTILVLKKVNNTLIMPVRKVQF